ncbi:helix-turn-helix transcriptional regulator [Streptomyces sp. AV19]|uniref:helix-turn-helix domain-containing protein n=1 Tax=Streptomyces sp. AV19 TaxID=2793068 RepID=UPI0018FEE515|nr:helix-turn-helix transcriptional regulator [Streptomyces sp. AV19]MBH1935194.1 helix-turn-helix transcriptional regulator [Streptomyces sp. AV19]MDG4532023.1 helix-turn-helix transcriptional regulator [Streptomyces sp. AV19]
MTAETDSPDPTSSLLAFFGSELKRVRTEAGKSQGETARLAHTTQAMISYVESAKRVPSEDLARDLDVAFGTGGHFGRLYPLVIKFAYPSWFLPFVELEREAAAFRSFEGQVVPGLLQTEDYARSLYSAVRPDNLDELVAGRITRQGIFEREMPPHAWFVMDEYVLLRQVGGPAVMRGQLERLLSAGESPRTVIQVIPASIAAHPGLEGPFMILGFDEGEDVLYIDGFARGYMTADATDVGPAARTYDLLRATALSPVASAELIEARLKELRR